MAWASELAVESGQRSEADRAVVQGSKTEVLANWSQTEAASEIRLRDSQEPYFVLVLRLGLNAVALLRFSAESANS